MIRLDSHLDFLRKLQRLLSEGSFSSTYKYALLQSLADLSVERSVEKDGSLRITVSVIAEKFIQYYWPQTLPYSDSDVILRQNTGKQAAIINRVAEVRAKYDDSLSGVRARQKEWAALQRSVASVVRVMPLWKLQTIGSERYEFIYKKSEYKDGVIRLLPGAVQSFRDMYVIITSFVRGAWVSHVQNIGYNRVALGSLAGLPEFLFGADRGSVAAYKDILQEYQGSRCFYCGKTTKTGDLDHFIPWSKYPIDLGHNFVFAHSRCNNRKRDFLAHADHLGRWKETNLNDGSELANAFDDRGLSHDQTRSEQVAIWAYQQGEAGHSHVWLKGDELSTLGPGWRAVLLRSA
jgi:HNH endonuclease